jgi:hypothetical protein
MAIPHPVKQDLDISEKRKKERRLTAIVPVLLIIEKDEKYGYFRTHFMFFTGNLVYNMKHYINTVAKTLKPKL